MGKNLTEKKIVCHILPIQSGRNQKEQKKQAGAELCQAQFKLGLAMLANWGSYLPKLPT
jgi:hypothetical protein